MAIEWLALGPNGEITDATRAHVLRSVLIRSECVLNEINHPFEIGPSCSLVERCRRILVAAQGGQLSARDYEITWHVWRLAQRWEASRGAVAEPG